MVSRFEFEGRPSARRPLRRAFAAIIVITGALLVMLPQTGRSAKQTGTAPADLVVLDANVLTVAPGHPHAQAFAVREGRFVAVGRTDEIKTLIGPQTEVWRLKGKTITPGFNDAHLHPAPAYAEEAPQYVVPCGPDHVRTIDDLIAALKHKAGLTPAGQIIRGFGYDEAKLGRTPTCHDLDRASTEHPIVIRHASGHLTVCNSYALKAAGITRDTPNPPGGVIGKDGDGEPNGYLAESAGGLVANVGTPPPPADPETKLRAYLACFQGYAAKGITSAGVAGTDLTELHQFEILRDRGILPTRLNVMLTGRYIEELVERLKTDPPHDGVIRLGAIKIFHGNSLSGRTCWLSEPYADKPGYYGVPPARTQEQLDALVWSIHHAGLQVACHSNGDREIDMVLTAIERAQAREPRPDARHRIEHCSVVRQDLLERIKRANVVVVPHSYEWEHGDKFSSYGAKRWDWMFPNKRALDMGIAVANHSDSPISAADPMLRIQCLVTRQGQDGTVYAPAQRLTPEAALRIWTAGGAYASFEEKTKGAIAPGMLADFVVLAGDPTHTKPTAIRAIRVERTVMGGKTVYERTRDAARLAAYAPGSYHLCADGDEGEATHVWP
jgi:predicted amidohydrolase YtcJ